MAQQSCKRKARLKLELGRTGTGRVELGAVECKAAALLRGVAGGLALLGTAVAGGRAVAQALPTATRPEGLAVFAGYLESQPDYGVPRNNGLFGGVDYTRYGGGPVALGLEARVEADSGKTLDQRAYEVGPRVQFERLTRSASRLHVYADFLVGTATLSFKAPPYAGYYGDRGLAFTYGGGIDVDIVRNFQMRIDAQGQHWNFGENGFEPTGKDFILTPSAYAVGVRYVMP